MRFLLFLVMGIVAGILFDRLAWLATKPIAQPLTSPPETIPFMLPENAPL
jgi:hypothetical protein